MNMLLLYTKYKSTFVGRNVSLSPLEVCNYTIQTLKAWKLVQQQPDKLDLSLVRFRQHIAWTATAATRGSPRLPPPHLLTSTIPIRLWIAAKNSVTHNSPAAVLKQDEGAMG